MSPLSSKVCTETYRKPTKGQPVSKVIKALTKAGEVYNQNGYMELISAALVEKYLSAKKDGEYNDTILGMSPGMALKIPFYEWHRKTAPGYYFLKRYNGKGKKVVSVRRCDGFYLVVKL